MSPSSDATPRIAAPTDERNLGREPGLVDVAVRATALGYSGATIWLTGLPASGKSTVAELAEQEIIGRGRPAFRIDGDNLRRGLCADLGFAPEDRAENVRRAAHAAALMTEAGVIALVALVSPYAADRDAARALHERDGLRFLEVFVDAPVSVCASRDPKQLYARAARGEISDFTGVSAPYEAPVRPDLVLRTGDEPPEASVERLIALALA